MEAGDEGDGEEALRIHLSPQEKVSLQVVEAEVVLAGGGQQKHRLIRSAIARLKRCLNYRPRKESSTGRSVNVAAD